MPKFSAPVDLQRCELRNAVTQNLGTAPASPVAGLRYYDSILKLERFHDGTNWINLGGPIDVSSITGLGDLALLDQVGATEIAPLTITDAHISATAAIALSKLAVDPLDRVNHTGTQLAATISDFDTQVRTSRLDQMAMPTSPINVGGQTITNLGTPVLPSDAPNKAYVDDMASGISVKDAVRVTSTGNVDLAAPGTAIDGITLANGDRVLLKDQTDPIQNGIYIFNGSAATMTRAADADQDAEVKTGMYALTTEGTVNINTGWMLTTPNPVVVDTTPMTFSQFSAGGSQYMGTANRITVTGTQIDIAASYVGQASLTTLGTVTTGTWQGTPIDIAYGGTGATTAAGARTNLGVTGKYTQTFGDGSSSSYVITHGLNATAIAVEVFEVATGQTVYVDVARTSTNAVRLDGFGTPPAANSLAVVVVG